MDLFEALETKTQTEDTKETKEIKQVKISDKLIEQVMQGGKTAKEEAERPFWEFSDIDYPYEHFHPAFLMSFGDKGSGKSTSALSVSGNVLAITFEKRGNLTRPWARFFNYNPRIQIFSFSEYIDRTRKGSYRDTSNEAYIQLVNLMNRASALERKFDWVVIDGLQAGTKLAEQRMRALNNVGATEKFANLSLWNERSMYFESIVIQKAQEIATKGVYLTSQNVVQQAMFLTAEQKGAGKTEDEIPIKEPKWKDKIKDDVDAVIYHTIREKDLGKGSKNMIYRATVSTNKLGAVGEYNLTVSKDNTTATKDFIKDILTQENDFVIE